LNQFISKTDKDFDILKFAEKQLLAKEIDTGDGFFIISKTYSQSTDNLIIYPKTLTGAECDEVTGEIFGSINPKHKEYMKYGATKLLIAVYGDNKEQAKNRALRLIEDDYEDEKETPGEQEQQQNYLFADNNGTQKVNTGLLAEYIRTSSNYIIVRKQGYDKEFIYWYEKGFYRRISPNELKGRIKEFIPKSIRKSSQWEEVYKEIITDDCTIKFEELNKDYHLINFKNGLYNTKTKKLEPHDPKYLQTIQLNCNYDAKVQEPTTWLKFINTLAGGDADTIKTLQEWFGFTISNYQGYILKKMMALYGVVGNTGKTRYTNMLTYIIGQENVCSKMIQEFSGNFGTGALYGTKAVIIDDQTATGLDDPSVIKAITGSGYINMKLKGVDDFLYYYTGNITFNCNGMFFIKGDKGNHMFERFLIIPCDNVIPEEERDKSLDEKLRLEVDGIIQWALEGLHKLIDNGFNITISDRSKVALEEYREINDTIFRYLTEKCSITKDMKDKVAKKAFEDDYIIWCKSNDYEPLEKKNIKYRMKGHEIICNKSDGYWYYRGVVYTDLPF